MYVLKNVCLYYNEDKINDGNHCDNGLYCMDIVLHTNSLAFKEAVSIIISYQFANKTSGNQRAIPGNKYINTIAKITIPKNGIIPLNISISSTFLD